ncbi:MAG: phosphotransferase, partial [Patescibacteria group bacterium]
HGNYIGLMLNLIHKWKDRCDRLVALHGDFWGTNLFFKKDGSIWVIDYSRIPWGDRGIDIGWWLSQYLWFYHETQNEYFKELGEKFLDMYEKKSGDKEIRRAVSLALGLMGIIYISPRFYPDLNMEIGKKFFYNILEILNVNQFVWKK